MCYASSSPHDTARRSSRSPSPPSRRRPARRAVDNDDGPRVSFQEDAALTQIHEIQTALSCMATKDSASPNSEKYENKQVLWYSRSDLKEFRKQAQHLCQSQTATSGSSSDDLRGLELRTSVHRQERKQLIVRRILQAQDKFQANGNGLCLSYDEDDAPTVLAQIAQEHSIWSRKLALAQAHKDYYEVYHPDLACAALPEMPAVVLGSCGREFNSRKRGFSSPPMAGRRVRCRMF